MRCSGYSRPSSSHFLITYSSFNRSLQQNLFSELEYSCVFAVCVFFLFRSHLQNDWSAYTSAIYSYHIWKCKYAFVSKQNLIENGWRDTIRYSIGLGIVEIENCETRNSYLQQNTEIVRNPMCATESIFRIKLLLGRVSVFIVLIVSSMSVCVYFISH